MSVYTMPAVGTSAAMLPANCSWCFTCQALTTTGGITSSTSDLMPLVYFNNGPSSSIVGANLTGTPGTPVNTTTALGANAPFQSDGAATCCQRGWRRLSKCLRKRLSLWAPNWRRTSFASSTPSLIWETDEARRCRSARCSKMCELMHRMMLDDCKRRSDRIGRFAGITELS